MLFDVLRANVLLVDIEHFGLTIIHRGGAINIVANENTDRNNNIESYMLSTHLVYPTCYYGYFCCVLFNFTYYDKGAHHVLYATNNLIGRSYF